MLHYLKKRPIIAFIYCLAYVSITRTYTTTQRIDEGYSDACRKNLDIVKQHPDYTKYKKNPNQFYKVIVDLYKEDSDLCEGVDCLQVRGSSNTRHTFALNDEAPSKMIAIKDVIAFHFDDKIPVKYIQLYYKEKNIISEKQLIRILNKRRQNNPLKPICLTYKILFFPFLFLAYKDVLEKKF